MTAFCFHLHFTHCSFFAITIVKNIAEVSKHHRWSIDILIGNKKGNAILLYIFMKDWMDSSLITILTLVYFSNTAVLQVIDSTAATAVAFLKFSHSSGEYHFLLTRSRGFWVRPNTMNAKSDAFVYTITTYISFPFTSNLVTGSTASASVKIKLLCMCTCQLHKKKTGPNKRQY